MSAVFSYQPYKDRRQLLQELRMAAVRAAAVTPPQPDEAVSPRRYAPTPRSFSVDSVAPATPPQPQSLVQTSSTAENGGSGVVVSNRDYTTMQQPEEVHYHHHHHHHHYHDSDYKDDGQHSRGRRASWVLQKVGKEVEHQHAVYDSDSNESEIDDDNSINDSTEDATTILNQTKSVVSDLGLATAALKGDLTDVSGQSFSERLPNVGDEVDVEQLTPLTKAGYLVKSPYRGQWRKRFFTLVGRTLTYTKDESSTIPKCVIDLSNIVIITDKEKVGTDCPAPYAILLQVKSEQTPTVVRLGAESYSELLEWYYAIAHNASIYEKEVSKVASEDASDSSTQHVPGRTGFYPLYRKAPSYYDLLGIAPDASHSKVKQAYRKLARELHPDRNPDMDPKEFATISQAYDVLVDDEKREEYDLSEKIKDVLRRGFICVLYIPTKMAFDEATQKSYPSQLEAQEVLLYSDGDVKHLYYQEHDEDEDDELREVVLHPSAERRFEMRQVQRITLGRNDIVLASAFGSPPIEEETRIAMHGAKLKHDVFIEFDTAAACHEMLHGLRRIRCEGSELFAQNLKKWNDKGYE